MFLDLVVRRNPGLVEAAIDLHQTGRIPAGSYVLDLDAMAANAAIFLAEAGRLGLTAFGMTKQFGRNPDAIEALARAGMTRFVAVDMACGRRIRDAGVTLGHLGHLVQVPRSEAPTAAAMRPEFWTVFNLEKAREAAEAAVAAVPGRRQPLLARIHAPGDTFYPGHEGGFPADDIVAVAEQIDRLPGASFAGVTTFPALLFDHDAGEVRPTPNLATLNLAAERLRAAGHPHVEINAPGTTSTHILRGLADAGATQVEPGHGLTGTTPLHAVRDLEEQPAAIYLTEVSHLHAGRAYCFGTGFYIDPVFPDYPVSALVGREGRLAATTTVAAEIPPPGMIDYYGQLQAPDARVGDSVIFGFRIQAFFRRAFVVGLRGVGGSSPEVAGVCTGDGATTTWPR
jgi:predicted amino acid racemase